MRKKVVLWTVGPVAIVLFAATAVALRWGASNLTETTPAVLYDQKFFDLLSAGSSRSAARILPEVVRLVSPRSAVDLGAGNGEWLAELRALGVTDVLGVDGDWVKPAALKIPQPQFKSHDLRTPLALDRTFDLAISMETAEHLPPERSEGFIADLVALAPVILFSAAVPGQGGTDHINERWPDYWESIFSTHGYVALDVLRTKFWDDDAIAIWYRQNAFLYVRRDVVESSPQWQLLASLQPSRAVRIKR